MRLIENKQQRMSAIETLNPFIVPSAFFDAFLYKKQSSIASNSII